MAEKGVFGIYFGFEEIQVRLWTGGETRPILKMPAVYTCSALGEVLAGNRAVYDRQFHREKRLYSVLEAMQAAEYRENGREWAAAEEKCNLLMRDLRETLDRVWDAGVSDCVIAVPAPSLRLQKSIHKAMEEAGFHGIRQLHAAVACAVSQAYRMTRNQFFSVCAAAGGQRQYAAASYEEGILEILDYAAELPAYVPGSARESHFRFYAGDSRFFRTHGREAEAYEDLPTFAADGAAIQGASAKGLLAKKILVLELFPWKIGLELADAAGSICFPLAWMIANPVTVPTVSHSVCIRLDSGIGGKSLRLYTGRFYTGSPGFGGDSQMVREWKLEESCAVFGPGLKELKAAVHLYVNIPSVQIQLQEPGMGGKKVLLDFLQ